MRNHLVVRLLFTAQPAYGHLHPVLAIAEAARSLGHDAAIATSALFAPAVESAGFRAIAAGLNWLEADKTTVPPELKPPPDSTLEEYFAQQFVRAPARLMARDLIDLGASWRPDAVVSDRTEFGGAIAAAALKVPSVAVQVGNPSLFTPSVLAEAEGPYNEARLAFGLSVDPGLTALESRPVLMSAPPGLNDPAVPLPTNLVYLRPTAFNGPAEGDPGEWASSLARGRPLVYATLGTVFNDPSYDLPFFPALLDGLRNEPLDLLLTVGPNVDPAVLGGAPPNVRIERYVPQSLVFPKLDAVVFHGGFGTLLAAIEHGLPVVVVPFGADQHLNAAAVVRLGIGVAIDEESLDARSMRDAVRRVLDEPSYREKARRLRDTAAALPSVDAAIRLIENAVSTGLS
jgi:UDP:flavonoid glycosyltransferase YjiC (YdhE family)